MLGDAVSKKAKPLHPMRYAIPDAELRNFCHRLISVVMDIPEDERGAWYRSLERYVREHDLGNGFYDARCAAACALRLARGYWGDYPLQESETSSRASSVAGPRARGAPASPDPGDSKLLPGSGDNGL
jgi:hypothetical protein